MRDSVMFLFPEPGNATDLTEWLVGEVAWPPEAARVVRTGYDHGRAQRCGVLVDYVETSSIQVHQMGARAAEIMRAACPWADGFAGILTVKMVYAVPDGDGFEIHDERPFEPESVPVVKFFFDHG